MQREPKDSGDADPVGDASVCRHGDRIFERYARDLQLLVGSRLGGMLSQSLGEVEVTRLTNEAVRRVDPAERRPAVGDKAGFLAEFTHGDVKGGDAAGAAALRYLPRVLLDRISILAYESERAVGPQRQDPDRESLRRHHPI